jgi:UDP-N-acetyl-2-amino-2-deoxyglucuronate dehydrogenase
MKPLSLSVAIVGAGIIGRNHANAIIGDPNLHVAALIDPVATANAELATWVADQTGETPPQYASLSNAIAHGDLDLVVICTPSGTHTDLASEALAAGLHVVIEKPLDASLPAARRLAQLAADATDRGLVVSVISQHRFDPASVVVAEAVAAGAFGRITSAVASVAWWRGQDYYDSAGWRGTWAQDGGGATMNQGVHTVDLLIWLLGRPVEVFAFTGTLAHERIEVEDVAVATVRFASGALAVLHATTAAYPGLSVRLAVHGDRGSAIINDDQLEYFHVADGIGSGNQAAAVVSPAEVAGAPKPADAFVAGYRRQYADIVDAIASGRPPLVDVDSALLALVVVKSLYLSASLHAPIALDAVLAGEYDDRLDA